MVKFISRGLVFVALSAIIYCGLFAILCAIEFNNAPLIYRCSDYLTWKGGNAYTKFREFDPKQHHDVIVLGSSHAYRGYDPRIFQEHGYSLFNLGSSSQSLMNSYFLARAYVTKQNCELLIIDLFEGPLMNDGMECTSDLTQGLVDHLPAWQMALSLKDPRALNMLALRHFTYTQDARYLDTTYWGLGYSMRIDSLKQDEAFYQHGRNYKVNPMQLRYLNKLLRFCNKENIPVVLTTHPTPKRNSARYHRGFSYLARSTAEKYDTPYFDYAFAHRLHTHHHFYDNNHMNQAGVDYYNHRIIQDLQNVGFLN